MAVMETKKLDELLRSLPKNSGVDPRLVEAAKTELNLLKFRAGSHVIDHKQESWAKSDVEKLQTELQAKDTEIYILKQQLIKVKERGKINNSVTDLTDPNAPVKLRDKYNKLFEVEWNDAYDYFKDKGWNDIEIIVTLQRILRASHRFCHDVAAEQLQNIEGEALYPSASWMDDNGIITRMKTKEISQEITNLAKTYQRSTGQRCLSALQKTFTTHVIPTFIDPDRYLEREVNIFTKLCVEITWFMCIQDPPMAFVDKIDRGAEFNGELFRRYKGCSGHKFDYLVWPALLLYEGGPLVVKGVAQPIKKKHAMHDENKHEYEAPQRKSKIPSAPYTDNPNVDMATRNPEDWVDLNMDEEDDPWAEPNPQTPTQVYTQVPYRDEGMEASSPYFHAHDQNTNREIPTINIIADTEDEEEGLNRGGSSYRSNGKQREPSPYPYNAGTTAGNDLTVQWKKEKQNRTPSAP